MKKKIAAFLCIVLVAALLLSCGESAAPSGPPSPSPAEPSGGIQTAPAAPADSGPDYEGGVKAPTRLSVGTGTAGGTQFIYMSAVGNIVNNNVKNLELLMESTTGGINNMALIQAGEMAFGQVEQSNAYDKYYGYNLAAGDTKFEGLRTVFPCYTQDFLFSAIRPDLQSLDDINKEDIKIALGSYGGSLQASYWKLVSLFGLQKPQTQYTVWSDTFTMIGEGKYDATLGTYGHPSSLILEYCANSANPPLLHPELTKEQIQKICEAYPYYAPTVIPAEYYPSLTKDYNTFGAWQFVYSSKDVDPVVVYEITKAVFEHQEELVVTLASAVNTIPENITQSVLPIHEGALRYYREIGIEIPDELIPPEAR